MPMCSQWNNRLREAWEKSGLLQKELAHRAGLPASTLNKLMSVNDPEENPGLLTLLPVLRELHLTPAVLFDEDAPILSPRLTPYDTDKDIRAIADALAQLSPRDRLKVADFVLWVSGMVVAAEATPVARPYNATVRNSEEGAPGEGFVGEGFVPPPGIVDDPTLSRNDGINAGGGRGNVDGGRDDSEEGKTEE